MIQPLPHGFFHVAERNSAVTEGSSSPCSFCRFVVSRYQQENFDPVSFIRVLFVDDEDDYFYSMRTLSFVDDNNSSVWSIKITTHLRYSSCFSSRSRLSIRLVKPFRTPIKGVRYAMKFGWASIGLRGYLFFFLLNAFPLLPLQPSHKCEIPIFILLDR